ncbi:hypothetical protein [Sulfolobus acidocaldarius]|uniref:hypothetical protein n=1 Tax=Sulfolobus acidocaldarius TaxID=2285 RepID=UPI0007811B77|nr:hypothetical protein [Sulfolobus acidocaldarius]
MVVDEKRVREIVREELETFLVKSLAESLKELHSISQDFREQQKDYDKKFEEIGKELAGLREITGNLVKSSEENTKAIAELRKMTEENTKAIIELRKQTEENTKAIARKMTEENTKAIIELRKQTEENTKAIAELRKMTEENTKAIIRLTKIVDKLVKSVSALNERVSGLENTFGLMTEEIIRRDFPAWLKNQGIDVSKVSGKTIKFGKKNLEFDVFLEYNNKVYLGEVKATLRERDVKRFYAKVEMVKKVFRDKEIIPIIIFRLRAKGEIPIRLAKNYGIKVLKYLKGGEFDER